LIVRRFLIRQKIPFEELDVERTPGALLELQELTGSGTHVPVLAVTGEVFVDFDGNIAESVVEEVSNHE